MVMVKEKAKVAFILPVYEGGGAERVTDMISAALNATGRYDCTIMVWKTNTEYMDIARSKGLQVIALSGNDNEESASGFQTPATTAYIGRLLGDGGFSAAVIAMLPLEDPDTVRRMAPGCRLIYHHHGMPMYEIREKLTIKAEHSSRMLALWREMREKVMHKYRHQFASRYRMIYESVDNMVVLCPAYKQELDRIVGATGSDSRISAIYNPVAVSVRDTRPADHGRTVLYVGRLNYSDKRPDRLLRIWAQVAPEYSDWRLKIVGDGPYRADMERMVQDLGIAGSVEFCGYCSDPTPYYAEASILCLTSEFEGWGMVLAEGQQAGVWPMAFDVCAGVRELVGTDGTRGTLVRPYSEKAYAGKLKRLMADPARLAALRPSMMTSTAKYAPDAVIAAWDRYLSSL